KHTPRSFIGHSEFALQLFGTNTSACRRHQECRVEPGAQRGRGLVQDGVRCGRKLITASVTSVDLAFSDFVEQGHLLAGRAFDALRIEFVSKPIQTSIIVRKLLVEVLYRVSS